MRDEFFGIEQSPSLYGLKALTLRVAEQLLATSRPVAVDPVKATLSIP